MDDKERGILLRLYLAQCCGVASLAEDVGVPSAGWSKNFEFGHGADDSLPTLREIHHGIFNVHRLMLADGTPV